MSAQGIKIDKKDAARKGTPGNTSLMILFSVTIFLSASLLFLVEPMFAKFVLPSFGGTPAVWTGSMMFFQAALLTSYLYVHATTTWLGARKQAVLHLVLVLLPLLVLPLAVPADDWAPSSEGNPIFLLLGLLAVTVGLPFFAISATNPLIQRWLADTDHPAARDPYFLYRASNLGSVIGLLGYPLLVERELTLANQGIWWSIGYGLLILLVFASAVVLWRSTPATATEREEESEPLAGDPVSGGGSSQTADPSLVDSRAEGLTLLRRLRWIGLTFVPSSLMLGVTAFLTTDITPVPLLWVIPLSLYLFSFVVVFSPSQRMPDLIHKIMVGVMPVIITTLVLTTVTDLRRPYWALILLHLIGFFVVAMVLHGEVARDRPPARNLTEFYLWVAVGGVLGGVFNALVAPVAFDMVVEYPLVIILACLFVPGLVLSQLLRRNPERERDTRSQEGEEAPPGDEEERETITSSGSTGGSRSRRQELALDLALPVALGLGILALGWVVDSGYFDSLFSRSTVWQLFIGLAAAVCLWFAYSSSRPIRFGLGIAALVVAVSFANGAGNVLFEDRSFFGVYKVSGDAGTEDAYHALVVGDTNHGAQLLGPQPPTPIAYHDPSGPFGQLFDLLPSETTDESPISVLGLGAGVMSCYAEPGQRWTYYEIDPAIEAIARNENLFTYLRDCPGEYDVVLGDARLKLSEAEPGSYGMIIGEAFSSDAIPVHMLTREATDMYFDKLNENGVLVHHISNRHLELEPVVGDLARDRGLTCYTSYDDLSDTQPSATSEYKLAAHFTVLARDEADLGSVPDDPRWAPCQTNAETDKVWTDDYSNLLSTFAFQ
jgi:hypothetical protein